LELSAENEVFLPSAFSLHKKHKFASVRVVKAYGIVEVQLQLFISSALYGNNLTDLRPGRFTPGKISCCPLNRKLGEPQSLTVNFLKI
jgi:hypothetical protein